MRPRIIALAAFALAAPATAQDGSETAEKRTVEGAQQFLAEFYERGVGRAETAGYESGSEWRWQEAPGFTFQLIDGVVNNLRPVGRCKSVITISTGSDNPPPAPGPLSRGWTGCPTSAQARFRAPS